MLLNFNHGAGADCSASERTLETEAFHTPTWQIETPAKETVMLTMVKAYILKLEPNRKVSMAPMQVWHTNPWSGPYSQRGSSRRPRSVMSCARKEFQMPKLPKVRSSHQLPGVQEVQVHTCYPGSLVSTVPSDSRHSRGSWNRLLPTDKLKNKRAVANRHGVDWWPWLRVLGVMMNRMCEWPGEETLQTESAMSSWGWI